MTDPKSAAGPGPAPAATADETARAAEDLIERFGGIRPMAAKLGIPATTVQGWKKRGHVPDSRRADILAAAAAHGIALSAEELDRATTMQPEEAEGGETPPPPHPEPHRPAPGIIDVEPEEIAPSPAPDPVAPTPTPPRPDRPATAVPDPAQAPPPPHSPPPHGTPPTDSAPRRTSRIGATAFVVAVVGLGVALLGLMRQGDLPGLGVGARSAAAAETSAAVETLRTEISGLARQLEQAQAEISRLAERPVAADQPAPSLPADLTDLPDRTDALSRDLADLAAQVQALAERPVPSGDGGAVDLTPVARALDSLSERVARLETAPAPAAGEGADPARVAALESALTDLSARLDGMEERLAAQGAGGQAAEGEGLIVATGQLQAALAAGRPYRTELRTVQALAAGQPQVSAVLAEMEPRAEAGLPTATALRARFDKVAADIIQADRMRADAGWVDQTLGRVSSLITVRRASGEVAGDGVDAVVSRAEAALDAGDLGRAVAELSTLTGPPATAASDWLADARARAAAEEAVRSLNELAVARLAGTGGEIGR